MQKPSTISVIGCVQADVLMGPVTDLPAPGGTLLTDHMTTRLGGAGANAALAAVEAGMGVRLVGCIGDDQIGMWMHEQLAAVGLADDLSVVAGDATGLTVALESPARDRTFLTYLGVNARWDPATIPGEVLDADNVLLCDYFMAPPLRGAPALALLNAARARGARTFLDTSWDPGGFPDETRAEVTAMLPLVDVFVPNEAEARALAGASDDARDAASALQAISDGWVVVKLGPRGCVAAGPDGASLAAAAPEVTVADTTGAGDAFNAGLAESLARGAGWDEALRDATRFATRLIARPSDDRHSPVLG